MKRFQVRTLIVAVALVAIALGVIRQRQLRFRRWATDYAHRAAELGIGPRIPVNIPAGRPRMALTRYGEILAEGPEARHLERRHWWLRDMAAKYERAASAPWLPVLPDLPPP
jgi:hypothetical protein